MAWPLRARDLCETLDLGFAPKNIEGMRSKLKSILAETEPGLFAQAGHNVTRSA